MPTLHGLATGEALPPNSVMLTERGPQKLFGRTDVVGERVVVENRWDVVVAGVTDTLDFPSHIESQIAFFDTELFLPLELQEQWQREARIEAGIDPDADRWGNQSHFVYLEIPEDLPFDEDQFNARLDEFVQNTLPEERAEFQTFELLPMKDLVATQMGFLTGGFDLPTRSREANATTYELSRHVIGYDFSETMAQPVAVGRGFERERTVDLTPPLPKLNGASGPYSIIINDIAARSLGFTNAGEALGESLYLEIGPPTSQEEFLLEFNIIGGMSEQKYQFIDFAKPILIANALAWPLGYVLATGYTSLFAADISINLWPFLISLGLSALIAFAAVFSQSMRSARVRPAAVLRYE